MKKVLVLILLMIVLVGCNGQTVEKTTDGGDTKAFIGGDKGIDVTFFADAPQDIVYDNNFKFDVSLRVENVGEADIPANQAKIKIRGITPDEYGKTQADFLKTNTEEWNGASLDPQGNEISGSIDNAEFKELQAPEVIGSVQADIIAEVCYPYKTTAVTQICILEDLLGRTRKSGDRPEICEVNEEKGVQNSGAPVKITNVKEAALGEDKIQISFDIEHVGTGGIYKLNSNCEPDNDIKDKVNVKVESGIAGGSMTCSGLSGTEGEIAIYGNSGAEKRTIVCTQTLPTRVDSKKQIKIELEYNYLDSVATEVLIKHI